MKLGVARQLVEVLRAHGIEDVFFVTGGDQPLWIALQEAGVRLHLARSESGAVYMADGFARATGRPAVVYGQWGPGATNVAAALADAWWSRTPVVALTSHVPSGMRYRHDYQEVDQQRMFAPVTVWSGVAPTGARVADLVRQALHVATAGSPRPTHLDLPRDVLESDDVAASLPPPPVPIERPAPSAAAVARLRDLLANARRPLLLAGGGVHASGAYEELAALVDERRLPVVTSMGGKGAIAETHELALGVVGSYARKVGNDLMAETDLLVVLGSDLGGMVTAKGRFPRPGTTVVQVDLEPADAAGHARVDLGIQADVGNTLAALRQELDGDGGGPLDDAHDGWARDAAARLAAWRDELAAVDERDPEDGRLHPAAVMREITAGLDADSRVVTDTGYAGAWVGTLVQLPAAGRRFFRAAGSLGWALPASFGVGLAAAGSRVVCVTGDGGFGYHAGELETAARLGVPVTIVVLNNASLAFEYHMQKHHYAGTVVPAVNDFLPVDHAAVAAGYGIASRSVDDLDGVRAALAEAAAADGPFLIDIATSRESIPPVTSYEAVMERTL